jgi:hypothetical protein
MSDTSAQGGPVSGGTNGLLVPKLKLLSALTGSDILALIIGAIWMTYGRSAYYSTVEWYLFLGFIWLLGVAGIVFSEFRWGRGVAHKGWFGVGAAVVLGLFLCWFSWWLDKVIGEGIKSAI